MNALDGSSQTRLTKYAANDSDAAHSPDGKEIAFASDRTGNDEVYVMNALDGSRQQNRTNNSATDWVPDWGVRVR